jgi:tetratricopeptide (TPR) repeat protein
MAALRLEQTDPQALHAITTYFISTGDLQKSECVGRRLVLVDPNSNEAVTRGYWNINANDPEGALQLAEIALASHDTALAGHDMRGMAFILLGNAAQAEKESRAALAIAPNHYIGKSLRALAAAARGDRASADAAIRSFENDANRNHWAAMRIALCYGKFGERDLAVRWLRRAAELGNHSWYALIKHPWLQSLQADPEFQAILGGIKQDLDDVRDDVVGVYQLMCK